MKPTAVSLLLVLGLACCMPTAQAAPDQQAFDQITRGKHLATAGDCTACHTVPGGKPFAGGFPVETPFGVVISSNLTPDEETGIGNWSDDQFVAALQHGKRADGKNLYPAMPYPNFTKMSREDGLAIRAYLATLAPVHNAVVSDQLPFPLNIRFGMTVWNALFFNDGRFQPDAGKSAEWNRGAYLVEGPGHCGACHTPKNFLGGDKTSEALQGGVLQGWLAPNLTGDRREGLGSWSVEEVVDYLQTGGNDRTAATGPMKEVISDSTSHLSAADLKAVATYLKDQAPPQTQAPSPIDAQDPAMQQGRALYVDNCAACHDAAGTGIPHLFPALKGDAAVQAVKPVNLLHIVLAGAQSAATDAAPTGPAMPAMDWKLNDDQVASVLTYIRNAWGNAAPAVSADDVKSERQKVAQR